MYVKATLAALAIAVAAPAFASDSLARSIGVEPGVYTTSQLIALKSALESDEHAQARFIMSQAGEEAVLSTRSVSTEVPQFAIDHARQSDEVAFANFLERKNAGEIAGPTVGSQGHVALANSLGLDWQEYSVAELINIRVDREADNGNR